MSEAARLNGKALHGILVLAGKLEPEAVRRVLRNAPHFAAQLRRLRHLCRGMLAERLCGLRHGLNPQGLPDHAVDVLICQRLLDLDALATVETATIRHIARTTTETDDDDDDL